MTARRVLVALEPGMYSEGLAILLSKRRPRAEVSLLGPTEDVEAGIRRVRPHLLVAHRVPSGAKTGDFFWVEVADPTRALAAKSLGAEISANGHSKSVADVRAEHVLEALDGAEGLLVPGPGRTRDQGRQGGPDT